MACSVGHAGPEDRFGSGKSSVQSICGRREHSLGHPLCFACRQCLRPSEESGGHWQPKHIKIQSNGHFLGATKRVDLKKANDNMMTNKNVIQKQRERKRFQFWQATRLYKATHQRKTTAAIKENGEMKQPERQSRDRIINDGGCSESEIDDATCGKHQERGSTRRPS